MSETPKFEPDALTLKVLEFKRERGRWPGKTTDPAGLRDWYKTQLHNGARYLHFIETGVKITPMMGAERYDFLLSQGMDFRPKTSLRNDMAARCIEHFEKHRAWPNPISAPELSAWLNKQVKLKDDTESPHIRVLRDAGFNFEPGPTIADLSFEANLSRFCALQSSLGGRPTKVNTPPDLYRWMADMRRFEKLRSLLPQRRAKLIAAGFDFQPAESDWQQSLNAYLRHFDGSVPITAAKRFDLNRWYEDQVQLHAGGFLSDTRARQMMECHLLPEGALEADQAPVQTGPAPAPVQAHAQMQMRARPRMRP